MAAGIRVKVPKISQVPELPNTLFVLVTERAALLGVTELVSPLSITVVEVVQLNSNGVELANVTVKVFNAHGFDVLWATVALIVTARRLRGSASPRLTLMRLVLLLVANALFAKAKLLLLGSYP
jgi:hypothetical protein